MNFRLVFLPLLAALLLVACNKGAPPAADKSADATADTRTTAAIKLKLAAEPELSALQISVDTTAGLVTLAGKVKSAELAERAVAVAGSVDGVREVKSTLQVNPE